MKTKIKYNCDKDYKKILKFSYLVFLLHKKCNFSEYVSIVKVRNFISIFSEDGNCSTQNYVKFLQIGIFQSKSF
jgi:hypothetical protein